MGIKIADVAAVFEAEAEERLVNKELKANAELQALLKRLEDAKKRTKAAKIKILACKDDPVPVPVEKYVSIIFDHRHVDAYDYDLVSIAPKAGAVITAATHEEEQMKKLIELYNSGK